MNTPKNRPIEGYIREDIKDVIGLFLGGNTQQYSYRHQFHRQQISNTQDISTPFIQDESYSSTNIATLGPLIAVSVTSHVQAINGPMTSNQPQVWKCFGTMSLRVDWKGEMASNVRLV